MPSPVTPLVGATTPLHWEVRMTQLRRWWFLGAAALTLAACTESTAPAPPAAVKLALTVQRSNATSESAMEGGDDHRDSDGIQRSIVCFSVKNGTDVNSFSVTGTLFHRGRYTSVSKVILLNHGTASNRGQWDGGAAGDASPQIARLLASAGYVVITYDRLGFGQSVYAGDPRTLTQFNSGLMMHQRITHTRTGTFTRTRVSEDDHSTAACPTGTQASFGIATVIIGGH